MSGPQLPAYSDFTKTSWAAGSGIALSVNPICPIPFLTGTFRVEHLIRSGKKKIVHLAGPACVENAGRREKGYRDALEKFRIPSRRELCSTFGGGSGTGSFSAGSLPAETFRKGCAANQIKILILKPD